MFQIRSSAPNDTGRGGPRSSAAPTALPSSSRLIFQPFRAGSRLAVGPPGLAFTAILQCHFFLNLPQASRLLPRHAPRHARTGRGRLGDNSGAESSISRRSSCKHTFRHTYRSWLDETGAPLKVQLGAHASRIDSDDDERVYGQAMALSKREANNKFVEMVLKPVQASAGNHDFSYSAVVGATIKS
jgi:hypothetical protein